MYDLIYNNTMDSNRTFVEEFIKLYRENRCLWDVHNRDYSNKYERNLSYEILQNKFKEVCPNASLDYVKKKINNLRTTFRRELKKVQESKQNATDSDKVYEPNLWYYDLLLFTVDQSESPRKDKSSFDDYDTDDNCFENDNVKSEIETEEQLLDMPPTPGSEQSFTMNGTDAPRLSSSSRFLTHNINKLAKRRRKLEPNVLTIDDDEYVITGRKIAYQLKGMVEHQRLIAEKLISDIMYYGRMGKLSEDIVIHLDLNK